MIDEEAVRLALEANDITFIRHTEEELKKHLNSLKAMRTQDLVEAVRDLNSCLARNISADICIPAFSLQKKWMALR